MPDAVLTRDGPVSVPMDYVVPASGELLPVSVRATIDGTSAASQFYATVQVLAPSGRVMGSYISTSIAAGASADVTWFQGVGSKAGTLTLNALPFVRVNAVGNQTVNAGDAGETQVIWGEAVADTGVPSPFWNATLPTRLTAPVAGWYLSIENLEWDTLLLADAPAYTSAYLFLNGAVGKLAYLYDVNVGEKTGDVAGRTSYSLHGESHGIFHLNAGDYLELQAYNNNAGEVARDLIDTRPSENHYSSWTLICVGVD